MAVRAQSGGGYRISASLGVNATYKIAYADEAGNPPRVILEDGEEIERTFFFHARPPPDGEHAEMGFHEVTATLESTTFPHHETDRLVVEIPTELGRVHRSVLTHTPTLVPAAAADNGTELRMTLGATLLNGGETTEVKKVLWTGPEGVFQAGPRDNDDVRTTVGDLLEDSSNWEVRENGSVLAWTGGGECTQLDGCSVAANVTINGSRAPAASPWRPTTLHTLYEERHVQPYLDWFVRSKRAWRGVPADGGAHAGFALGSEARLANPGAAEGAFLWRIPPSSSPMCTDDERAARSQPDAGREGDRRVYDFGPREDGLPVVGDRVDVEDTCTLEEGFEPRIPLIAKSHDRWTEDAIGRSSYQAVDGIPQDILTDWQNGVAESSVTVDEEAVEAGDTVDATVKLESLFDRLADQGLSEATVEARMLDPYNTWQDRAWWNETLLSKGSIDPTTDLAEADCTVATPVSGPDASSCEYDPMGLSDPVSDGDTAANEIDLDVELPDRVVPGTHLLVVDVSWNYTGIEETGHLIEPVDVLLPGGHRGSATLTEGVAWLEDWR